MKRLVLALMFVAGCSDSGYSGDAAARGMKIDALAAQIDCACFWDGYGYASVQACTNDRGPLLTTAQEACVIAVAKRYPRFGDQTECRLIAANTRLSCFQQYDDSCDPDGFDACDEARDTSWGSCPDPCLALSGNARTECDLERAQLQSDSIECFVSR